ncbi:MAG TPA: helix-hairpin-helix domain-containing protein [Terriglobales bacterium]|nr:helix-hairpin-helix domain-containing protein [Terriglobales bacterium]
MGTALGEEEVGCGRVNQPFPWFLHPIGMRAPIIPLTLAGAMLLVCANCNKNQSPQQLRQETAQETAALKRDTAAVAEGIKDGLRDKNSQNKLVNINKATKTELTTLPGIDARRAEKIIAERPYSDKYQTVSRGALSDNEYAKIQDQITVAH